MRFADAHLNGVWRRFFPALSALMLAAATITAEAANPEPAIGEIFTPELARDRFRLPANDAPLTNLDTPKVAPAVKPDALGTTRPVRLGIPYFAFPNSESLLLSDTVAWLKLQFGDQLNVEAYQEDDLRRAIERGAIDLFISSAGLYREFSDAGSKDLATLTDEEKSNPNASAAAAVIVRADRSDLQTLADLKRARISAGFEDFFAGWDLVLFELKALGEPVERFFSKTTFSGMPMSQVVERVLSGEDDAGVLAACYLEGLRASGFPGADTLRVLNLIHDELGCAHSTRAYPGMTIATMPTANPETMRAVTRELFSMPPSGSAAVRWSVATDFSETDQLLRSLSLGPYRHLRHWTVSRLWDEYWHIAALVLILALGMAVHSIRTESVVRKRTALLQEVMSTQRRMQSEAAEKNARIELLEREGVVQQLSSMLAHELRQPMTAIGFFTKGLIFRLRRGQVDREAALSILEKIRDLNQQSNAIVDHVRGYAKERIVRAPTNVSEAARFAIRNLVEARYSDKPISIKTEIDENLTLVADKFELELIINNLVKNAAQACIESPSPEIIVSVRAWREDTAVPGILLTVTDNGPVLSQADLEKIGRPFSTSKKDGLGLGTSIVRRIAESYGGRLAFRPKAPHGLIAEVLLFNPIGTIKGKEA